MIGLSNIFFISFHFISSYCILIYFIIFHLTLSYFILLYFISSYLNLFYFILFYLILSIVFCLITFCFNFFYFLVLILSHFFITTIYCNFKKCYRETNTQTDSGGYRVALVILTNWLDEEETSYDHFSKFLWHKIQVW